MIFTRLFAATVLVVLHRCVYTEGCADFSDLQYIKNTKSSALIQLFPVCFIEMPQRVESSLNYFMCSFLKREECSDEAFPEKQLPTLKRQDREKTTREVQ